MQFYFPVVFYNNVNILVHKHLSKFSKCDSINTAKKAHGIQQNTHNYRL